MQNERVTGNEFFEWDKIKFKENQIEKKKLTGSF